MLLIFSLMFLNFLPLGGLVWEERDEFLALRKVSTKPGSVDADLFCYFLWGSPDWGSRGWLKEPYWTGGPSPQPQMAWRISRRSGWVGEGSLQIPTLAHKNKPHIIQSGEAEGQG